MELKFYHMLNKKHEALIPELDRVINEMIEDGTLQKIKDSFKD
jgi:ABC-type amino acid transport substrate-binding protein